MKMFDRGISCTGQAEGGVSDALFEIKAEDLFQTSSLGPTRSKVCIVEVPVPRPTCGGPQFARGILHQEAIVFSNHKHQGGGVFGADDKVVQHF